MGKLFTVGVGNLLTVLLGNVLTAGMGKVLDIYNGGPAAVEALEAAAQRGPRRIKTASREALRRLKPGRGAGPDQIP
jgi:hypothetical protein